MFSSYNTHDVYSVYSNIVAQHNAVSALVNGFV